MKDINPNKKPDYDDYISYMESLGWHLSPIPLTTKVTRTVTTSPVKKEEYEVFLDIRCPAGEKITFPGLNQFDIDKKHFSRYPNLYQRPYSLSIRCKNNDNEDMDWNREVRITKEKTNGEVIQIDIKKYDDISIKADSRYKRLEERYYFEKGVELNGEEHLRFFTRPDIDITSFELFTKADFWTAN